MTRFRFGGVYAVCYTGNQRRYYALLAELRRIGVEDAHIVWSFPTPYKQFLLSKIPHIAKLDREPSAWGATFGQYEAIKTAHELGQDRVLIVEDDCRFLLDVDRVNSQLLCAPADWDILMLDHFNVNASQHPPVNGWARTGRSYSTACYVLRRKAMGRLLDMYESPVSGKYPNPMMRLSDDWLVGGYIGRDVVMYNAVPNLAIQQDCGDLPGYSNTMARRYSHLGNDMSHYAPFVPDIGSAVPGGGHAAEDVVDTVAGVDDVDMNAGTVQKQECNT